MRKFLALFFLSSLATAQPVMIQSGFVTGNHFKEMKSSEQTHYIMGVIDGIFLAPLLKAPEEEPLKIKKCIEGMYNNQLTAIVNKYMMSNPERWHENMHTIIWSTFLETCEKNS